MTTATKLRKSRNQTSIFFVFSCFRGCRRGALTVNLRAETGYDLWLRYVPLADSQRTAYRRSATAIVVESRSPTGATIVSELQRGLQGLLGVDAARVDRPSTDGAVIVGTPSSSPLVAALGWTDALARAGHEGYVIRSASVAGHAVTVIASAGEAGALYGTFHFLRLIQTRVPLAGLDIVERPRLDRRLLNHWDNLDGTIERGYAGGSLWWPDRVDRRLVDYARANASIGINGTVINSVNANPQSLTAPLLEKAAAIARIFRPYGIRVYLAANFAAPKMLGSLTTDDPLDPAVARWWREKADEIYTLIPDFGGFVVKANSEGQPGPQDYGRTHADGANVLADAVAPHAGIVMWRAFVYDEKVDPDRVKRAYMEFVPLDGRFRENVFAQVKNGPLDFQPREPFHPLFGAMPKTPLMAELQITQEYLGQSNHLVYLAPMWKEFLDADTYAKGTGSTVTKVIDGTLESKATDRHCRCRQHRARRQLDRPRFRAGQLVRLRPAGLGSGSERRRDRGRMDRDDLGPRARAAGDHPFDDARLARGIRALHHAARAPSPDWRRPLRADAREHGSAPGGLVRHLLSPRRRVGHRLRSHAPRQWRGGTVPLAAARAVEQSRDHSRRAALVVSSPALGLPHEVGTDAVGRAGPVVQSRGRRGEGTRNALDDDCAGKWMRNGTRPCSPELHRQTQDAAAWRDKCVRYFQARR